MNSTICWFPLKPTEKPKNSRMLNNAKVLRYSDFCCNQMSMFQRSTNSVIYDEGVLLLVLTTENSLKLNLRQN